MFRTLNIAVLALSTMFVVPSSLAQTISSGDAPNHIGEQATVCGKVTDEYQAKSHHSNDSAKYIYLDSNQSFNVLTWYQDHTRVGKLPRSGYICVRGNINKYLPEDIIVFEPCPKDGTCTYHNSHTSEGTQIVLRNAANWYIPKTATTTATGSIHKSTPNATTVPLSTNTYYTNSSGNSIHAPAYAPSVPAGATAQCSDGTYSFSQHHQGTCSHHGGVAHWLQ